jgi:hypothetical protein
MNRVISAPRLYWWVFSLALLMFLGAWGWSIVAAKGEARSIIAVSLIYGFFVIVTVIELLECWRWSLIVRCDEIVERGIVFERRIKLAEVIAVRWRARGGRGRVVLHSASQKITIPFELMELTQRRETIRFLRTSLPDSIQTAWDMFCFWNAYPLLENRRELPGAVASGRLTRRQFDMCFVPCILVTTAVCVFCWLRFQNPLYRGLPLVLVFPWLGWRFLLPPDRQQSAKSPISRTFVLRLALLVVSVLGLIVYNEWIRYLPHGDFYGAAVIIIVTLVLSYRDYRQHVANRSLLESSVREWDRVEKTPDTDL